MSYEVTGVKQFSSFWEESNKNSIELPSDIPEVQALFLGIKPACLHNKFALQNAGILRKYGIDIFGRLAYRKDKVEEVLKKHPSIFHDQSDADEFIEKYDQWKEDDIQLGLILGYPLEAAEKMQRWTYLMTKAPKTTETLEEINAIKNVTKGINVYGMSWMSFGDDQSKALQKHLTHVFEESGILAIAKAYIENHFPELKMDLLP